MSITILGREKKTSIIKRTIADLNKYREYILSSISTGITSEYANSYLGYVWWVLDPLLFMLIYVFVVQIVLGRGGPQYPVFVFSALLFWRWTQSAVAKSTRSIISAKSILSQTYIPKFIFPFVKVTINSVYFLFSILILAVFLIIYRIPFTFHIIEFIPIFIVQYTLILGLSLWLAHLGVYYYDVDRILGFVLRLWYYVSPGLYPIEDVPEKLQSIIWLNPLTTIFVSSRNVFMYGKSPVYIGLLAWFIVGVIFVITGLLTLYKFDKTYAKIF